MKTRIVCIFTLFILICACSRKSYPHQKDSECYNVLKIKSNKDYYEIYARKDGEIFKIISRKEYISPKNGEKVDAGKCYSFTLKSSSELSSEILGVNLLPANYMDAGYMYGDTLIKIDGGSKDLYYATNLKDLYFITEPTLY